ncbi:hypothetical protein Tco_1535988, partial [Tanacetum coccineum]
MLKTARSRQKSYADKRRKPLEFKIGDRVLLNVSQRPSRFLQQPELVQETTAKIFQIKEMLKTARSRQKSYADKRHVQVPLEEIEIDENLRFVEEPIEIMKRDVKKLKRRRISLVKVRWNSRQGPEFTWEHEDQFQRKYPHLFSKTRTFVKCHDLSLGDKAFLTGGD